MADIAQALHDAAPDSPGGALRSESLPELQAIVKKDPHNFPALSLAGFCLREAGRTESALNLFQRAQKENDLSAVPVANAAGCLLDLGASRRPSASTATPWPSIPPRRWRRPTWRGCCARRGDRKGAVRCSTPPCAPAPTSSDIFLERGLAARRGGQPGGRPAPTSARRRGATRPTRCRWKTRRGPPTISSQVRDAALIYEQLLRLAPNRGDLWKTAGAIYLYELEDRAAALRCFRRALLLESDAGERAKLDALVKELGG